MENKISKNTDLKILGKIDFSQSLSGKKQINPMPEKNHAFIDMQNLHCGVKRKGWKINWKLFGKYLKKELNVEKAIVFMGFIKKNRGFYNYLKSAGFILEFRKVTRLSNGRIDGGNVDADLASYVMDHKQEYDQAILVADDGDYCRTAESLARQGKLKMIISPHSMKKTSYLLKRIAPKTIISINSIRSLIEYKQNIQV